MTAPPDPDARRGGGISIRQPYAACILAGAKTVENRSARWRTGWVLLHTSKTIDRPALHDPLVARTVRDRELVTGAVVGVARIVDCHQDPEGAPSCSAWAHPGAWHVVLDDVQELALPIPARGQLGPWRPTEDLVDQVLQQLPHLRP
ncbi:MULTISPECIES: hypothetical protein [unclassified Streptomyces]|uniref:hypothetical protein n=1 Tax=unclassified Streptomyces TaxID=2593676 RepID=UPI002E2A7B3A|nr:hypothetical protein [Streptomyces sp. NBC_01423]WSX89034.1 hypothetical protein OH827_00070 [Streptomyces sp. NBC_00891]WSY03513.1 hypothetical protein OG464_00070 [Streptomyces sp. NBC_00890]WSZ05140.1 hypothetical protein OG704_00070 [Streptomyces sp. NBC_00869]WSZ21242.1 hypothetical protein OG498_00070 [Streptomyces sp. NBC_00870]WSX95153.1 hypothetical protein OH827_33495 [Streptomyces sp. NBC_00891]